MADTAPLRRSNAERTAATRAKILSAAASCLAELGYAETTTTEVARRAGVSRGAQLHNFPTKVDLVVAAAQYVFDRRVEEVRAIVSGLHDTADRADAVIELIMAIAQGESFEAIFELIAAARTHPELRSHVAELSDRFTDTIDQVFTELFPPPRDPALMVFYRAVPTLFVATAEGLALRRFAGATAGEREDTVVELTKFMAQVLAEIGERGLDGLPFRAPASGSPEEDEP